MRKLTCALLCLLMILSTAFCLTGCKSRTDEMVDLETYTTKQMNKTKKKVIKCINEQDKEGLKKLFSKDAQKHIEDLDSKLDQFINTFNGNKIESKKVVIQTLRDLHKRNHYIFLVNIILNLAMVISIFYLLILAI